MIYLSPIKVNLFLSIVGKRNDGYHELETIFQLLDFYDEITIDKTTDGKISRIAGNENIPQNEDLMIRAAKILQEKTKVGFGVNISINKKIPTGGGLGGGSSNAATVLLALNKIWQTNLSNQELQKLGLKLGADVPVFVSQKTSFATGIGEKLTPINLPQHYYLILCPSVHTSTKKIFSHFALTRSLKQGKIPSFLQAIDLKNDCINAVLQNDISGLIKKSLNYLNSTKNIIGSAKLSGTGSCVFAIFDNFIDVEIALNNHSCKDTNAFIAKSIG